ncbi:MAG: response regulator [Alphaproteobacteria bacterium]|nr:response regulator [Alphaproteobacteria bacterium]
MVESRILLVDDDPDVLELTAELLGLGGYIAVPVSAAAEALALLAAGERFAAMVTDQSMPGMSGEELVQRARAMCPDLPCMLISGYGAALETTIEVKMLRKPFRANVLNAALRELIGA